MPLLIGCVEVLTNPLAVAMLIGIMGVVALILKRPKLVQWLFGSALAIAYLGSCPVFGNILVRPLERAYPPLPEGHRNTAIGVIVVLGSGYTPRDDVPITAALDEEGLVRIVEGIRLMRRFDAAKLVVSGGAPTGQGQPALGYAELARDLGIPESSLLVLDGPRNTAAEAQAIADLLGTSPFILVTSAFHMPRAMRLMRRVGAHPIPAPTGQFAESNSIGWRDFMPSAGGLRRAEAALHEYAGLAAIAAHIE